MTRPALPSAASQLKAFIAKFDPADQKLIRAVRSALRKRLPTAHELVYDNYNFLVIGFSPTARPSDAILSIGAGAAGLNLFFLHGARLPDPDKILEGGGKQVRLIRVRSVSKLKEPAVRAILDAAIRGGKEFPLSGRGHLTIRAVVAKQRPRRKSR